MKKLVLLLAAFALPHAAAAQPVTAPPTIGTTSSAHPDATAAGMEMLQAGGSATDAAMAMMLALTVVEPQSSGIGGGGFLTHHDAANGFIETIDGREKAPAAAGSDRFLDKDGQPLSFIQAFPGGKSVGVPGNIRLMALAHKKWGKLPWATLFQPAIRLAEQGYAVTEAQYGAMARLGKLWENYPEMRALFWRDGGPAKPGTVLTNPELGKLLRDVAGNGPDAFYSGATAKAIISAVGMATNNPSAITQTDLTAYSAVARPPVCAVYRAYRLCGMGPPSSGATTVFQILGMLERFDMGALGKDNPVSWHLIGEAMQLAYADREKYLGDADFVSVPVKGLLDRDYVASRSQLISMEKSLGSYTPGTPPGAAPRTSALSSEVAGTTHFTAVDGAGNIANMTSTVEGLFGSQLIARGMVLNNELTDFTFAPEKDGEPVANRVEPGKRPLSSMSPTIVYDASGKPIFALGSAGGKRIIMHVTKALIGVIDFGLPLEQAFALPNIYFGGNGLLVEAETPLADMSGELSRLGHLVVASNLPSKLNGAERTDKGWVGAVDPRTKGKAATQLP